MLAVQNKIKQLENIPQGLKDLNQWIVHKNKVPHDLEGKFPRSFKEPYSYNEAVESLNNGLVDGVGFALEGSGYMCLDFDADSLEDIPKNLRILENHTYAEISPSGNGIHLWYKGEFPEEIKKNGKSILYTKKENYKTEFFYDTGYVTFTGNSLSDLEISEDKSLIGMTLDMFDIKKEQKKSSIPIVDDGLQSRTDDNAVLDKALSNKHTNEIFNGYIDSYPSQSEADYGLCKDFAKHTHDPEQIERLMKKSKLTRHKFDESRGDSTYLLDTINHAISNSIIPQKSNKYSGEIFKLNVKQDKKIKKGSWWLPNENGTTSFLHTVMADYIMENNHVARYPDSSGYLHIYNEKTGVYEVDKVNRQVRAIMRKLEPMRDNQVREVQNYILDMSKIYDKESESHIAVNNGLIDISNVEFKKFTPNVFVTSKISTNYNAAAYDEFIINTLEKVTNKHKPSIKNLLEMFATVLYPKVLVPKMFYLYGSTAHNGKSSIIYMIHKAFNNDGGRISAVSPQKLAENTFAGSSLYGKLANIVDDQPDQLIDDAGTLKTIITGGFVDIEAKQQDSKTVEMNIPMITASNYYPNFKEHGNQINRRLHIIPFEHNFSTDPDTMSEVESMAKLSTDSAREYVLKLAVDTLKEMLAKTSVDKLTFNDKAEKEKQSFSEHSNPLSDYFFDFSKEYIESKKGSDIVREYSEWCDNNGITHKLGERRFKELVSTHYNMEWKNKRIRINGESKQVRGFKAK